MDVLHTATEDAKDVDLTIHLAGEAEQATIVDDDEIERELQAFVRDAEDEELAAKERAALEDSRRLEERLWGVGPPTDVSGAVSEPEQPGQQSVSSTAVGSPTVW